MNALREYSWLTGWLALPVSIFAIYAQNRGKQIKDVDWTWAIIYLTFGVTLGVTFTKEFDAFSRDFAKWLAMLSFFCIIFNRNN